MGKQNMQQAKGTWLSQGEFQPKENANIQNLKCVNEDKGSVEKKHKGKAEMHKTATIAEIK